MRNAGENLHPVVYAVIVFGFAIWIFNAVALIVEMGVGL